MGWGTHVKTCNAYALGVLAAIFAVAHLDRQILSISLNAIDAEDVHNILTTDSIVKIDE